MRFFSFSIIFFFNLSILLSKCADIDDDELPADYYDEKTTQQPRHDFDDFVYHDDIGRTAQLKERKYSLPAEFVGMNRRAWVNITPSTPIPKAWDKVIGFDQHNHLMIKATYQEHPSWIKLIPSSKMEYSGGLKLEIDLLNKGKRDSRSCGNPLGKNIYRKVAHLKFLSDNDTVCHYTITFDQENPVVIRHMHSDWEMQGNYTALNKVLIILGEKYLYAFPFYQTPTSIENKGTQYARWVNKPEMMPCQPPEATGFMNPPHDISIKFYTIEDYSPCQIAIIMDILDEVRVPIDQPQKQRYRPALPPPKPTIELKEWTIFENYYIGWNILGIYAFCCIICAFSVFAFCNPLTFFDTHDNLHGLPYDYFEETASSETESTEGSIVDTSLPKWFESSSQKQVSRFGELNFVQLQLNKKKQKKNINKPGVTTVSQVSQISDVSQISKVSTNQNEKKEENNENQNNNVEVTEREH
uniref:Uncharacterized protein n=1 Tax=Panagrolaimus sp. ES5 TaxID=591445 RepID=A0AC34GR68_9BILA